MACVRVYERKAEIEDKRERERYRQSKIEMKNEKALSLSLSLSLSLTHTHTHVEERHQDDRKENYRHIGRDPSRDVGGRALRQVVWLLERVVPVCTCMCAYMYTLVFA